jgi:hypothetical protein
MHVAWRCWAHVTDNHVTYNHVTDNHVTRYAVGSLTRLIPIVDFMSPLSVKSNVYDPFSDSQRPREMGIFDI